MWTILSNSLYSVICATCKAVLFVKLQSLTHLLVPATSTTLHRLRLHQAGVRVQYEDDALRAHPSSGNSRTCTLTNYHINIFAVYSPLWKPSQKWQKEQSSNMKVCETRMLVQCTKVNEKFPLLLKLNHQNQAINSYNANGGQLYFELGLDITQR